MKRRGRGRGRRRPFRGKREDPHKINGKIEALEVRVVGEGIQIGIYSIQQAMQMAEEKELDLVEISPKADPPVCKVMDYKKFLFQQKKKQKEMKLKGTKIEVKEIRFGPNTDEHDFNFKLNHAKKFLGEGKKLKAYVFFRGRSILFKEKGEILLLRLAQELEDVGIVEQMPKLEGKRMIMLFIPKKKK